MRIPDNIENLLRELLGNDTQIRSVKPLGGGCINHATKLSTSKGHFFAKWNDDGPADLFLREAECLKELSAAGSSLKIPEVIAATQAENGNPGILITEFLIAADQTPHSDEQLGRGLAELHRFTRDRFGFYHNNYCGSTVQDNEWNSDWASFFGEQRIKRLVDLVRKSRGLEQADMRTFEKVIIKAPELVGHKPAPALIHGDLWSGNYMVTSSGAAVIDPASCYADREFEFSIMNMFGGFSPRVFDAYNEAYPLPDDWETRNELYMLYHYLNHFHLFGGHYKASALSIAARYA